MKLRFLTVALLVVTTALAQNGKHPFTFEDMMKLKRVGAPVPSPDGKWVVFDCVDVDLEANTKISHLWIVPASGGDSRRLSETTNHEERPRFSPDGRQLIWTSKATDPTQIWMSDFDANAGTLVGIPYQVTRISTGADGAIWSPDGKNIVFVSAVYPDCEGDVCNQERDEKLGKSKVKAKIFTRLFYRHWNAFTEFKRRHLFVIPATCDAPSARFECVPRDLTPGDHDVPPFNLGGQDMYAISPDGQELAYTSNIDEVEATSTNNEIFLVSIAGATPKKISTSPGSDSTPLYSPDGKYLAWRSMARAGFEADKSRLLLLDRQEGKVRDLTEKFDHSVSSFTWASNSKDIFYSAEDHGESPIFLISSDGLNRKVVKAHADDLVSLRDGSRVFFAVQSISTSTEIASLPVSPIELPSGNGALETATVLEVSVETGLADYTKVTHVNDALLSQVDMQPMESFTFKGANNDDVQGFIIKPPGFDPAKKYPLKFLIHGGPQGAWGNSWSYRWNPELFAANGYVVVMINFHGSTGYGQRFTDSISGDWGGKPYVDLMKGLDYVEKTYPFIDKKREAALGASYGGYMANWLLGHTDRFKCIVSHDGTFNTESTYGTSEELWFPEWEFKGPPWKQRELYRKFSPHLFADKFKTPTLVVHGQLDYRLDVSEGFQLFTTLQRMKVPSKMLYFPDEGHWVLKPQNSQLWYKTVNEWVDQWCGK